METKGLFICWQQVVPRFCPVLVFPFFTVDFNIILPTWLCLPCDFFLSEFQTRFLHYFLFSSTLSTYAYTAHFSFFDLSTLITFGDEYKSLSFSLLIFSSFPLLPLLRCKYHSQLPVFHRVQPPFFSSAPNTSLILQSLIMTSVARRRLRHSYNLIT